jgi:hypothetical protein
MGLSHRRRAEAGQQKGQKKGHAVVVVRRADQQHDQQRRVQIAVAGGENVNTAPVQSHLASRRRLAAGDPADEGLA